MTTATATPDATRVRDLSSLPIRTVIPDDDAAAFLGTTKGTLRTWRSEGRGPVYRKVGKRVFYAVDDLESWILSHPVIDPTKRAADTV